MIIIGILAVIAVPVFLSQRAAAHDASTRRTSRTSPRRSRRTSSTATPRSRWTRQRAGHRRAGRLDRLPGHHEPHQRTARPSDRRLGEAERRDPVVRVLTDPKGKQKDYKFSGADGLETGTCS